MEFLFISMVCLISAATGHTHSAVETEMFSIPISPNLFNWTYQGTYVQVNCNTYISITIYKFSYFKVINEFIYCFSNISAQSSVRNTHYSGIHIFINLFVLHNTYYC